MAEDELLVFEVHCLNCENDWYCEESRVWRYCPVCGKAVTARFEFMFEEAET